MIVPFPPTPAICVPSRLHATLSREPELGFSCVSNHCMQCTSPQALCYYANCRQLRIIFLEEFDICGTKPDLDQILHYDFSVGHTTIHQQPTTTKIKLIILGCIIFLETPYFSFMFIIVCHIIYCERG